MTTRPDGNQTEAAAVLAAIRAGDASAFTVLAERYRRQLHVHCYRMLGSFEDAEDLVQETLLRAWRARGRSQGRSLFRTWLYRIATNACLNALERNPRRILPPDVAPATDPTSLEPHAEPVWAPELPWLQPYPDHLLELAAPSDTEPDAMVVSRETIELTYLAAIQHLPPRQRAILILRGALGWSAAETAALLETTLPSAPLWFDGREALAALNRQLLGPGSPGAFRYLATAANRQPAAACYLRRHGESEYRLEGLDVLRIEDGGIAEITTFTFVTGGAERALEQAQAAAGDRQVTVMGGAGAAQQFIRAGLLDELHLHLAPLLLGDGVRLFDQHGAGQVELEPIEVVEAPGVIHLRFRPRR